MRLRIRGDFDALRSSVSFSASGMIHGTLLALVVFGKGAPAPERRLSLYDEAIRGHEKEIVWYHAPDRLPDIRPANAPKAERRPLRAMRKSEQRIVAGERDDARPPQLVYAPPSVELPRPTPLPNVLAMEMKAPLKEFTAPRTQPVVATTPELPAAEAPRLAPAPAGPGLAPLKKSFTPPPTQAAAVKTPSLPDAGAVGLSGAAPAGSALASLKKAFTPPPARAAALTTPVLPDAEAVGVAGAAPAGPGLAPLKRTFSAPLGRTPNAASAALPDAEAVAGLGGSAPAGPNLAPLRKTFTAPPTPSNASAHQAPAPDLPAVSAVPAHLAIVGLDASKTANLPAAPPPRDAAFSAGPKPEPRGAATEGGGTGVVVPGVTVRDGPTRQSLLAAIRPMAPPLPPNPSPDSALPATRVAGAPPPSLEGRVVYTLAIQMPNVTSYSGSWLVWYAERRQAAGGAMRAPSPVRKVDPKYIAAAAAEGVQGVVRLGAIIRTNGTVEEVKLLRHLDDRLDRSAMEALAKWQFEPATRDGAPVEVDAVFEIPFRLAPKLLK